MEPLLILRKLATLATDFNMLQVDKNRKYMYLFLNAICGISFLQWRNYGGWPWFR